MLSRVSPKSVGAAALAVVGLYVLLFLVHALAFVYLDINIPLIREILGPGYFIVALWIGMALLVSWVAVQKGRSRRDWFWLGMFFSFIALIALAALPAVEPEDAENRQSHVARLQDDLFGG